MNTCDFRWVCRSLVAFAVLAAIEIASAADWSPSRPVRLIVPFPPAGAVDTVARIVTPRLSERLGQQVVIDNRGGANAIIGTELAARAAPDGHTLLIVPVGHAITPSVSKKLPYDSLRDFAAVGQVGNGAYALTVNNLVPATSVSELVTLAKARPGSLAYGYTGHGNATHIAGELFKVLTATDLLAVNYKGGGPALTDLIGGQIAVFFSGVASGAGHIRSGRIRALGVTTSRRSGALPNVPTIAEAGVPGYEVDGWYGLLAPVGTPQTAISRYNRDLSAIVAMPDMTQRLLGAGIDAQPSTPVAFEQRIARDIARWAKVAKMAKISPR